jgi:hypothetical protein
MQRQVVCALVRGEDFFEYRLDSVVLHKIPASVFTPLW